MLSFSILILMRSKTHWEGVAGIVNPTYNLRPPVHWRLLQLRRMLSSLRYAVSQTGID